MTRKAFKNLVLIIIGLFWVSSLFTQWSTDPKVNTPVSRSSDQEWHPRIVSDSADGAIIVWGYYGGTGMEYNISAQRLDAAGNTCWSGDVDICSANGDQANYRLINDGTGGVIVVWDDERNAIDFNIYAQRIDASGNVKWTSDGVLICSASNTQAYPDICSDGSGGAIITWRDARNYSSTGVDIYAQRINASGVVQWANNGKVVCAEADDQMDPGIISDGSGGAIITWRDDRKSATNGSDLYIQRINSSGIRQWATGGVGYLAGSDQIYPTIVSDGSGGAIIAWQDGYSGPNDLDIRALHILSSGNFGWTPTNTRVCGSNGNQQGPLAVSDGAGGAIIVWTDYRNGTSNPDIYIDRIDANGSSKWTAWGKPVCNAANRQIAPDIVSDDFGGAIITWMDERSGASDIYAQRFDANGNVKWKTNGLAISTAKKAQNIPRLTLAGTIGSIICWTDLRWVGDPYNDTDWDIYAQRVYGNGSLETESITIDVPNGGETWYPGTNHFITWHTNKFNDPVKIEYSDDNGSSYTTVVSSTANDGSYEWTVPSVNSSQCLVRISDAADGNPSDVSDAVFTIGAFIGLDVPNGGEDWVAGTTHYIVWHGQGIDNYDVKMEYSTDNGGTYTFINYKTNTGTSGSYAWTVPNDPSTQCLVKVSVTLSTVISDVSSSVFTISSAGSNNTQTGSNVNVSLSSDVTVTFDNVTSAGNTTLNTKTSGPAPPGGFSILPSAAPVYYDISSTATFTGKVKVCIKYDDTGMTSAQESALQLQVYESPSGPWNDITTSVETNNNIICGEVSHFSDFAVMTSGTGGDSDTLSISLDQGWNWISFNVQPADLSIDNVMENMSNLVIAVNGDGEFYIPNSVNTIGQIDIREGYKVYVSAEEEVSITGEQVSVTTPIVLDAGWNFISYLMDDEIAVEGALDYILPDLVIIKNDDGEFFIPNSVNTLGSMEPGEGYLLYMSTADTLIYSN